MFRFANPHLLWLLALVPVMIVAFAVVLQLRRRNLSRFGNIATVKSLLRDVSSWRVPKENYLWLGEYSKSDFSVFKNTHRDDRYIVVVNKSTGKIAVAYSLKMFEYKE